MSIKKITPANLTWDDADERPNQPRSVDFEDLYFSAENGLEESRYVFLAGNNLEERWHALQDGEDFTICETGFGSGLNLLASAELWMRIAPEKARLHFISTELYPMNAEDLTRTLSQWPELASFSEALISHYPSLTPGFHRFDLNDRVSVTLIFDEVLDGLSSLCPTLAAELWSYQRWHVDAWFLDGFAPAKNPAMWSDKLFSLIHRLSAEGTSVATFTCAGVVKRGLKAWGFELQKIPGFGRKREMLIARRYASLKTQIPEQAYRSVSPCWHLDTRQPPKPSHVAVIGAGIAGCTTVEALGRKGIQCTLFEANQDVAEGASGNPHAALYARLSPDTGALEDFCLHSLNYARGYYQKRFTSPSLGKLCGLVQLPKSVAEQTKMERIAQRFSDAPELLSFLSADGVQEKTGLRLNGAQIEGTELPEGGLWFPNSGWVNGKAFNAYLLEQSGARFMPNTRIKKINAQQDGSFVLYTADPSDQSQMVCAGQFDAVVLCTAMASLEFSQSDWLPIRPIRGQISLLPAPEQTRKLQTVLCRENYLTPSQNGLQSAGATYELDADHQQVTVEGHITNLNELQKLLGLDSLDLEPDTLTGRAGTRTTTPDYLPIVGTLPHLDRFNQQYAAWRKDRKMPISETHDGFSGLYLNLGYGSRGYSYAPLCAEFLAAKIARQPEPLAMELQRAIHPARFLVRSLSRNKILK